MVAPRPSKPQGFPPPWGFVVFVPGMAACPTMPATLDTRKAHLVRYHGDIAAIYTWVNDERALVLLPHRRPGAPWFIVREPNAHEYDDPVTLAHSASKACQVLGMEPSRPNWVRLATIIHEGLPDLIRMPPAPVPEYLKGSFGRMVLREAGQVMTEQDIRIEKEGPTYG